MKRILLHVTRLTAALLLLNGLVALRPGDARADRRYFVQSYTPFLAPAGTVEFETWLTAKTGKSDPTVHTGWVPRFEWEYGITDRLTGAAYLNFSQDPGSALTFESPALELIYALAERGSVFGDPALYLEVSETGEEMEIENKLLLAHRHNRLVSVVNLVSEIEVRHNDEEKLPDGKTFHNQFTGKLTAGSTYEVTSAFALGLEAVYRTEHPNFGAQSAAMLSLGPTLNLQSGRMQLALGVHAQLWGTPKTNGSRNLADFEKTQIRAILGVDL